MNGGVEIPHKFGLGVNFAESMSTSVEVDDASENEIDTLVNVAAKSLLIFIGLILSGGYAAAVDIL